MPSIKRVHKHRPRRRLRKMAWGITLATVLAVAFLVLIRSSIMPDSLVSQATAPISTPTQAEAATAMSMAEEAQQEPATSSEVAGKWLGLCERNTVHSVADFRKTVENDPVLAEHFATFNWETARLGQQEKDLKVFVSYRKGDVIKRTSKPVTLPKGDGYITDGAHMVRTFCCNDYTMPPPAMPSAGRNPAEPLGPVALLPELVPPEEEPPPPPAELPPQTEPPAEQTMAPFLPPLPPQPLPPGPGRPGLVKPDPLPGPPPKTPPSTEPVPEPATLLLLGSGLMGLAWIRGKRRP